MAKKEQDRRRMQMADIARLAGVSTATVSRALSNSSLIKEETRHRIAELARSLNYSVNFSAKNLRSGDNRTIGVVIPFDASTRQHISDPFFLGMLGSLADALTDQGYDLLLSRVDSQHLDEVAKLYETGRVKGIILIGQWEHHDQLNELAMRRIPLVVWGAQLPGQMYCSVGSDNRMGGQMATEHLIQTGCTRIAFFGDTNLPEVAQRYEGYVLAHHHAKLKIDNELHVRTPFSVDLAQDMVKAFLRKAIPMDGIFAASDLTAMNTMSILASQGIEVPRSISVVGYDDIDAAAHCHPPLTTIRQSVSVAGTQMVDCLEQLIAGQRPESRVLKISLTKRESTR
jgi:DNA-binding LacI/PurR family transcriptional regulator